MRAGCRHWCVLRPVFWARFAPSSPVTILVKIPRVGDESGKSLYGKSLTVDSPGHLIDMVKPRRAASVASMRIRAGGMVGITGKFSRWR